MCQPKWLVASCAAGSACNPETATGLFLSVVVPSPRLW